MLSKGIVIPLSFASLPVISITFFDNKKRSRRREEENQIDVPPDGLSLEDIDKLDLDELESQSSKLSGRKPSGGDPGVITIFPGWSFIPSITIALPQKGNHSEPTFEEAEDAEIMDGIRKAPLPDTLFSPAREHERPVRDRDVAEFDPETDAIIRPDADTESIVTPKVVSPPAKVARELMPEMASSIASHNDMDLDLDIQAGEPSSVPVGPKAPLLPKDHLIIPERPGADRSIVVPISIDRDNLNHMLGGGLPRGSIVLIEGKKGSGVEHFVQRLTYGLLQNNVGVTYISTENATSDFIKQMYGSGFLMANHMLGRKIAPISRSTH